MNPKHLGYPVKNIPIPSESSYLKCLIEKVEKFIKRLRWRAYFFDNQENSDEQQKTYFGFNTTRTPPTNHNKAEFENDLYEII